jgi:hypothetical protein
LIFELEEVPPVSLFLVTEDVFCEVETRIIPEKREEDLKTAVVFQAFSSLALHFAPRPIAHTPAFLTFCISESISALTTAEDILKPRIEGATIISSIPTPISN